jgi:L-ascorbate metabolism protein UlaG (beta-lactamase superfamily)
VRLNPLLLLLVLGLSPASAQSPAPTNAAPANVSPRALPVNPADLNSAAPMAVAGGVNVHWYGHGFIYLTSSFGIRCAIDPFGTDSVHYTFPPHLAADFVLVTHEAEDHGAADQIFGNPLIFRSVMAVGFNRANGIPFYGVALGKDPSGQGGANTAFRLKFDNITFCYLGEIYTPLSSREKEQLGKCDVLFLPVGLQTLSVAEFNQVAKDVGAKMIIPINYKTDQSGILNTEEIVVTRDSLPQRPTIYVLKSP